MLLLSLCYATIILFLSCMDSLCHLILRTPLQFVMYCAAGWGPIQEAAICTVLHVGKIGVLKYQKSVSEL